MAKGISDLESNQNVLKSLEKVKVYSKGDKNLATSNKAFDKRPKKENENSWMGEIKLDEVYDKYGYIEPNKLKTGQISLKKFDEFLNEYKKEKSIDYINKFAEQNRMDVTTLHVFLEHYKPFMKIDGRGKGAAENQPDPLKLDNVFPNLKTK